MKILLSGGHLTPALALAKYIQNQHPTDQIGYVARQYTQKSIKQPSLELSVAKKNGLQVFTLDAVSFSDFSSWKVLFAGWQFLTSLFQSIAMLNKFKPDVVVGFGSFVSLPVGMAANFKKIPVVIHEQASIPGKANLMLAKKAKQILVSHEQVCPAFPNTQCHPIGHPVRPELLETKTQPPKWFTDQTGKPILLITGGNQGSEVINTVVGQSLSQLTESWCVVHQTGKATSRHNYAAELNALKKHLPNGKQKRYFVNEWIDVEDMAWIFRHASAVICRAGANTLAELDIFNVPAVLIPLPNSLKDEQLKNAQTYLKNNSGQLLLQKKLGPSSLVKALRELPKSKPKFDKSLADHNQVILQRFYQALTQAVNE